MEMFLQMKGQVVLLIFCFGDNFLFDLALVDLYYATNGQLWKRNLNWLTGDPCTNKWYDVGSCSTAVQKL